VDIPPAVSIFPTHPLPENPVSASSRRRAFALPRLAATFVPLLLGALTVAAPVQAQESGALPVTKVVRARGYEVLVAVSDQATSARIGDALQREEMHVQACAPADAVAQLEASRPDAAIVDTIETLELFRERSGVDVIVIGDAAFKEKVRAIRSGAEAFVNTPLDMVALVRRVAALRERKERPARRILAVEDDAVTIALLRGILSSAGYEVEVCRDPHEFEKVLIAFQPDLVLMDVQLSHDVTGHDLVRYVRHSERFSTLPVIIVTSDRVAAAKVRSRAPFARARPRGRAGRPARRRG